MPRRAYNARRRPQFAIPSALLTILLTAVGGLGFHWPWLWSYLGAVNVVTVLLYAYDKYAAIYGGPRTPERVLHGIAIAGGTPGAYAAQRLFRHKTIKGSFRQKFLLIAAIQLLLVVAIWWFTN